MIHVKAEDHNGFRFLCGVKELPIGDTFFFDGEPGSWLKADCPGCNPGGPKHLGTPISQLSSTPGSYGLRSLLRDSAVMGLPVRPNV